MTFVPQLGTRGVAHLLDVYPDAQSVFEAPVSDLVERAELKPEVAANIAARKGFDKARREMEHCRRNGIRAIASTDREYPPQLRSIPDFPHVLYVSGEAEALLSEHVLSIVGTRRMTPYGERVCNEIVEAIAAAFPDTVIVSGLAFGTDAAAHRAALAFGLRTAGVVANALPDVVPAHNSALARDMVSRGGAVLSEVSSQTRQNGMLYIPRNRIVAGLGMGLVVVESPVGGGSFSTARAADGYSRTVMAVPGRTTDAMSAGTNALIRSRMAQLVASGGDVMRELGWTAPDGVTRVRIEERDLSGEESLLLGLFPLSGEPVPMERLAAGAGMDIGRAGAVLMELELSGAVRCLPGNRYEKLI